METIVSYAGVHHSVKRGLARQPIRKAAREDSRDSPEVELPLRVLSNHAWFKISLVAAGKLSRSAGITPLRQELVMQAASRMSLSCPILLVCFLARTHSCNAAETQREANAPIEREVTFAGAKGVKLAGTLLIPPHAPDAKLPGVVIVAGSGPTDRNGNSALLTAKINLLKQIAEHLAQEGIVSLRYDKRGQYASEEAPSDREALYRFCFWENYVGDAAAALAHLQEQKEIDASRTAMIGHSEGGMLVLQAAAEEKGFRKPPATLVLLSTPGRRPDVILREQLSRDLAMLFYLKKNDEIMEAIKKNGQVPDDVPSALAALYPPELGKFAQSMFTFDGPAWAAQFPGPVLVIAGEKDLQHKVSLETAALEDGLKRRDPDDHEICIVPGASHNLKSVTINGPYGYGGEIVPEAAAKLRSWLRSKLSAAEN